MLMHARNTWIALVVIAAMGCAPKGKATSGTDPVRPGPVEQPQEVEKVEPGGTCRVEKLGSCGEELEAVARCFFASVTAGQAEPGGTPLGAFMAEHATGEECEPLELEKGCQALELSGGGEVAHEHELAAHDNHEDKDVMHIVYTFSSGDCGEKAESRIELHVGE